MPHMKKNLLLTISIFALLTLGILGFSKPSTDFSHSLMAEKMPDTPETKEVMVVCQEVCKISGGLVSVAGTVIFLKLRLRMTA